MTRRSSPPCIARRRPLCPDGRPRLAFPVLTRDGRELVFADDLRPPDDWLAPHLREICANVGSTGTTRTKLCADSPLLADARSDYAYCVRERIIDLSTAAWLQFLAGYLDHDDWHRGKRRRRRSAA